MSKKRFKELEKRIADLEEQVQSQPLEIISTLMGARHTMLTKKANHHRSENQSFSAACRD